MNNDGRCSDGIHPVYGPVNIALIVIYMRSLYLSHSPYWRDSSKSGYVLVRMRSVQFSISVYVGSTAQHGGSTKEYTMRSVVMPRIAYAGQGANLSEAHIKRLDSVTLAYSKRDLRPLAGFPKAPMIHYQFVNYPFRAAFTMMHG